MECQRKGFLSEREIRVHLETQQHPHTIADQGGDSWMRHTLDLVSVTKLVDVREVIDESHLQRVIHEVQLTCDPGGAAHGGRILVYSPPRDVKHP